MLDASLSNAKALGVPISAYSKTLEVSPADLIKYVESTGVENKVVDFAALASAPAPAKAEKKAAEYEFMVL